MTRWKALSRVAALYGQVERVRLVELQQAAGAVAEAERLRAAAEVAREARRGEGRAALARGEGIAWRVAESGCEVAEVAIERAGALRAERETVRAQVGEVYRASRMRTEQVGRVVEALLAEEALTESRREQALGDDRYAARLCWTRMKTGGG